MFIPIGENLNPGWAEVKKAVDDRDAGYVAETAKMSVRNGAAALNLGGVTGPEGELENLLWLLETATQAAGFAPALDSSDTEVLSAAIYAYDEMARAAGRRDDGGHGDIPWLIVNSITGENDRYDKVAPLVAEHGTGVIALAMDDSGVPDDADGRVDAAAALVKRLRSDGVPDGRIFVDPLVMPVGVNTGNGPAVERAVRVIRREFPDVHITCGLSNVSAGLPDRELLAETFLPILIAAGLDSAIMDMSDPGIMKTVYAARTLSGADPYCADLLAAYRKRIAHAQA